MAIRIRRPKITPVGANSAAGTKSMPEVKGLREVQRLLSILLTDVPAVYEDLLETVGRMMEVDTKAGIKVLTGNLMSSVRLRKTFTAKTHRVSVIAGGRKAPHAHLVEFGHRMMTKDGRVVGDVEGKAFMRKAFDKNIPFLISESEKAIDAIVH
jgi:hypothetical protein